MPWRVFRRWFRSPASADAPPRRSLAFPAGLGLAAGLLWAAGCARHLAALSLEHATEPLAFHTWENIALLAQPRNEPFALPLDSRPLPSGEFEHHLPLDLPVFQGATGLLGEDSWVRDVALRDDALRSVGLYLEGAAGKGTPWLRPARLGLTGGELILPGGRRLTLAAPALARQGHLVEFTGGEASSAAGAGGAGGLTVQTAGPQQLYLRGFMRRLPQAAAERHTPPLGRLVIRLEPSSRPAGAPVTLFYPDGRVTYPLPGPPPPRLALLAHLHQTRPGVLMGGVVAAGLLFGAGVALIAEAAGAARGGAWLGGGVAAALLGLAVPAAIFVPSYQGLDELRHPLSYARLVGASEARLESFIALGQAGHVETLRWRTDLKVTAATAAAPEPFFINRNTLLPQNRDQFIPDYRARSPLVARLWLLTAPVLEGRSAGETLLALRMLNAAVGALLAGLGAALLAAGLPAGGGRWVAAAPLFVFVLPTYLGGLSNYAILAGAAALVAGSLGAVAVRPGTWCPAAAGLGLGLGLAWHTSVNAASLLLGAAVWLLHRPAARWAELRAGERPPESGRGWHGWLALAGGFAVTRPLATPEFAEEIRRFAGAWPVVAQAAAGLGLAVLAGCGLMAALEAAVERLACGRTRRPAAAMPGWAAAPPWILAAAVLAGLLASAVRVPPNLEDREQPWRQFPGIPSSGAPLLTVAEADHPMPSLPRAAQVREVLQIFALNLTPRPGDFILMRSFWGGGLNGDVRTPRWAEAAGALLTVGGLLAGLGALARRRRTADVWRLLAAVAALLAALGFAAAMYWPRNLYARYAMPLLLALFAAAALGWRPALERLAARWPRLLPAGLTALLLLLHGGGVAALARRFFG